MDNKKNAKNYYCEKCDFLSRNRYDFNKHLLTRKHLVDNKNARNSKKNAKPFQSENTEFQKKVYTCSCGKSYKYQSGLCKHRHKCVLAKKSDVVENIILQNDKFINTNLITSEMLNDTLQQQKQLIETIVEMSKETKNNTTNYYNNCNNKKMTINVFLNEKYDLKKLCSLRHISKNLTILENISENL
mgnify:CR=1 FL=1